MDAIINWSLDSLAELSGYIFDVVDITNFTHIVNSSFNNVFFPWEAVKGSAESVSCEVQTKGVHSNIHAKLSTEKLDDAIAEVLPEMAAINQFRVFIVTDCVLSKRYILNVFRLF